MKPPIKSDLVDGALVRVAGGTHAGKTGTVHDIKAGKTGHVSVTVRQSNGVRFKTLARNVARVTEAAPSPGSGARARSPGR